MKAPCLTTLAEKFLIDWLQKNLCRQGEWARSLLEQETPVNRRIRALDPEIPRERYYPQELTRLLFDLSGAVFHQMEYLQIGAEGSVLPEVKWLGIFSYLDDIGVTDREIVPALQSHLQDVITQAREGLLTHVMSGVRRLQALDVPATTIYLPRGWRFLVPEKRLLGMTPVFWDKEAFKVESPEDYGRFVNF